MHFTVPSLALFASFAAATCTHNTHFQKRSEAAFGYGYDNGPLVWHKLNPAYETCESGMNQSPINIDEHISPVGPDFHIKSDGVINGTFINLGTTLEVMPAEGDRTVTYGNTTYSLKQFHFHTPSEHHINGEYFPLEMHMVHQSPDKHILVVGLLFEISPSYRLSSHLLRTLGSLTSYVSTKDSKIDITSKRLDLGPLVRSIDKSSLMAYGGSLTTPPCTEGVQWIVSNKPQLVDAHTYSNLKKVMKFNSRYTEGPPGAKNVIQVIADPGHE